MAVLIILHMNTPCKKYADSARQTAKAEGATLAYYSANANRFASSTVDVEFSSMQARFTSLLSPGASILDFGCGSGRDAKAFADAGFTVTAIDGCPELCALASELSGLEVRCQLFEDFDEVDTYDGIWACSSILHLPKSQLLEVMGNLTRGLKGRGVLYTSFKHGEFEGMRNGRHFTDFTAETFCDFMQGIPGLSIEDEWITSDVRPGRGDEKWLNLILRKR